MELLTTRLAERALLTRQRLPERFGADAVLPSYDGLGLVNLAALATAWTMTSTGVGVRGAESRQPAVAARDSIAVAPGTPGPGPGMYLDPHLLGDAAVSQEWDAWLARGPIRHVVVYLSDALGYDQLREMIEDGTASNLARAAQSERGFFVPITTTYPSTTVTALTSLATACPPAEHGITGTTTYFREIGSTVNLIQYRPAVAPTGTPYRDSQLNPDTLVPVPNLFRQLERAGIHTEIVNYHEYRGSSISRFTTVGSDAGQSRYHGYVTPADGFAQCRARVQANAERASSYTYLYTPSVDSTAHRYGPLTKSNRAEAAALDFSLGRELLDRVTNRPDTALIVTADHGQRIARTDQCAWLNDHPELLAMLAAPITGERRAGYLHLKHGCERDAAAYIDTHLGGEFLAVTVAEAIALGLFGLPGAPLVAQCTDRIGDLLLIPRDGWTAQQHLTTDERRPGSPGVHGGLSRSEMLVPFLAYRLG